MDKKVKDLVRCVREHLTKTYGKKIKEVILYGSHVRNEATKDSDIDVLVVVDDSLDPFEVRRSLSDILFDILLEKEELISAVAVTESFFESYQSPFLLNVKEEGVIA